jgi:REP element-mobilizing transposase RayT
MARGLDRELIFPDNVDRERMLQLVERHFIKFRCACYAWVLMDNHYHFVVRPLEPNLATAMRRINGAYARYFNKRHDRRGYLFGDRYKSLATQELDYLRELIRYVHLNPLRARIVDSIDSLENTAGRDIGRCWVVNAIPGTMPTVR